MATIYADGNLAADCVSGNYSVANRNCTGSDGNAYILAEDAAATMSAGDTLYIRSGTYTESILTFPSGISENNRTVISGYPGELPTIDGEYARNAGIYKESCTYITVESLYLTRHLKKGIDLGYGATATFINLRYIVGDDNAQSILVLNNCNNCLVEYCIAARNGNFGSSWSSGINIVEPTGADNIVQHCVSFHNIDVSVNHTDGGGFIVDFGLTNGSAKFYNNLAFLNGGAGFNCTDSIGPTFQFNTSYKNNQYNQAYQPIGEFFIGDANSTTNATIQNNVGWRDDNSTQDTFQSYTAWVNSTVSNNYWHPDIDAATPGFVDPGNLDFNITSASPLKNAGSVISGLAKDIGFDPSCLKASTSPPHSWWLYELDMDALRANGVAHYFTPYTSSTRNDIGAYEYVAPASNGGGETVFPGTIRRFSPTILLTGQGGTTPSGWNSLWNSWCQPYYQNWIDPTEGVKMGLYHPAYALKNFFVGSVVPSDGTNPNDPAYDWSHFDAQLACDPIASGKAKFHFMLDVEGSTIPQWMWDQGYVHQPAGQKEVINYTNSGLVTAMKNFWTAFAARYNTDVRVYTILIDEDNSKGGVDEGVWQAGKTEVYTHCVTVCSRITVIVTMNPAIIEDLCVDTEIGPGVSDIKMFGFDCGATNFPSPGGYSCTLTPVRACERHNPVLQSPPRAARPTCLLSISNGYRIVGGSNGWTPPNLTNPWGELLPTPLEPPANTDTNVTPAIYAWYISQSPRGSNKDSGLGQAGDDPIGIIPSSYFCITTTGIRHANETPQDWNRALTLFGAQGTKAVPAIPVGYDPGGSTGSASASTSTSWTPSVNDSWFIQLDISAGLDTGVDVDIYDIDIFDNSTAVVSTLHSQGKKVIGYFSAGSYENWRPDEADFPSAVLGNALDDWPGERWLDVRQLATLRTIMAARMDIAVAKGFDGVDPDNVDGWQNNTGFAISSGHQIAYNQMLASEAGNRGLAVGLKNDPDQVAELVDDFDFNINEEAFFYGEELKYVPFITAGKAVFNIEYQEKKCAEAAALGFYHVFKNLSLDAYRDVCEGGSVPPPSGEIRLDAITTNGSAPVSKTVSHPVGAGNNRLMLVGVATEATTPTISAFLNGVEMWTVADVDNGWNAAKIFAAWDASVTYGPSTIEAVTNDTTAGTHIVVSTWFDIKQDFLRDTASSYAATSSAVLSLVNSLDRGIGGLGFHVAAFERTGRNISFPDGQNAILNVSLDAHTANSCWEVYVTGGVNTITTQVTGSADSMVFVSSAFDPDPVSEQTATFLRQTLTARGRLFTASGKLSVEFLPGTYTPNGELFYAYADTQGLAQLVKGSYPISSSAWPIKNKINVTFETSSIAPVDGTWGAYDVDQIANILDTSLPFRGNLFTVRTKGGWTSLADRSSQWIKLQDR